MSPATSTPGLSLEESIAEAQGALGPLFARPRLTVSLLARPPFRFLHDIVCATHRATGYPPASASASASSSGGAGGGPASLPLGFSPSDLDPTNPPDGRAAKLAFLGTLVRLVDAAGGGGGGGDGGSGAEPTARPARIAAGRDPARTSALLARLGRAAVAHRDVRDRVARCDSDAGRTREAVSAILQRPRCTDRLLARPPYRFLLDAVAGIDAAGGGRLGLGLGEQGGGEAATTKEAKRAFLRRVIGLVEARLNVKVEARPKKIIAGLEPERTCHFLQLLVVAATSDPPPLWATAPDAAAPSASAPSAARSSEMDAGDEGADAEIPASTESAQAHADVWDCQGSCTEAAVASNEDDATAARSSPRDGLESLLPQHPSPLDPGPVRIVKARPGPPKLKWPEDKSKQALGNLDVFGQQIGDQATDEKDDALSACAIDQFLAIVHPLGQIMGDVARHAEQMEEERKHWRSKYEQHVRERSARLRPLRAAIDNLDEQIRLARVKTKDANFKESESVVRLQL